MEKLEVEMDVEPGTNGWCCVVGVWCDKSTGWGCKSIGGLCDKVSHTVPGGPHQTDRIFEGAVENELVVWNERRGGRR
jgi:hypothetical protein